MKKRGRDGDGGEEQSDPPKAEIELKLEKTVVLTPDSSWKRSFYARAQSDYPTARPLADDPQELTRPQP